MTNAIDPKIIHDLSKRLMITFLNADDQNRKNLDAIIEYVRFRLGQTLTEQE